ncbi:IclR family transcriptional regulator [Georgenia sp. MJ170]|uniref:IclR family transcriptional regulator n=1 Tax=Georgenia sunbinii TaxID=3117728 RepID=UPI002F260F0D
MLTISHTTEARRGPTMAAEVDAGATTYPIRAVDRVCDILDALADAPDGSSLSVVAERTGLPKSSTFRYLTALEARHYVEREVDGMSYRLGLAFRPQNTRGVDRLAALARPYLDALRDQFEETANLGILDGSQVVHVAVAESPLMMRLAARVGERGDTHCTALGKAMCATLPPGRVRAILDTAGMPRHTAATITDPDAFMAELARTHEAGYGIDEAENQPAGRCVAVAIGGLPFPAGISVSAPMSRLPLDRVPDVVAALQKSARKLARAMRTS